jgi:hypothetical protein
MEETMTPDGDQDTSGQTDDTPAAQLTVEAGSDSKDAQFSPQSADPSESGGDSSVSDIIAIGTTAAKILSESAPDYSMQSSPVSVLPSNTDPMSLTGTQGPQELRVSLNYTNGLGMLIIQLPIVVQWRYGGSLNGVGAYVTGACAFLDSGTDVGVFYKADVSATLNPPFNAAAAGGAPIAALGVHIEATVKDKIGPLGFNVVLEGTIRGDGSGELRRRSES